MMDLKQEFLDTLNQAYKDLLAEIKDPVNHADIKKLLEELATYAAFTLKQKLAGKDTMVDEALIQGTAASLVAVAGERTYKLAREQVKNKALELVGKLLVGLLG